MLVLDVGTSSVRSVAYDTKGRVVSQGKKSYQTQYPHPGWATQDPADWEKSASFSLKEMVDSIPTGFTPLVLTLTGQCPTYVPLDRSLRLVSDAMIYQDNRAVAEAEELESLMGAKRFHQITGHSPWAFYILPKVMWQKKHQPDCFEKIEKIVQPTDYLAYILTGELATDQTHANATLMYDIHNENWSDEILTKVELSKNMLPARVLKPWQQVGTLTRTMAEKTGLPWGLPVFIGAADSQCSCLGTGALDPSVISEMSGTSSCLNSTVASVLDHLAVGHYNHVIPNWLSTEMGLNTTGAAVKWFLNGVLKWKSKPYVRAEKYAEGSPVGCGGLCFIPYLSDGERDTPGVKGGFYGLTMNHSQPEMIRSVFEGVAFSIRKRVDLLVEAGCSFQEMRVSGGGAKSDFWNQMKANILKFPVRSIADVDGAELGAAMLGAIGAGIFPSWETAVENCVPEGRVFIPQEDAVSPYEDSYQTFLFVERMQM